MVSCVQAIVTNTSLLFAVISHWHIWSQQHVSNFDMVGHSPGLSETEEWTVGSQSEVEIQ